MVLMRSDSTLAVNPKTPLSDINIQTYDICRPSANSSKTVITDSIFTATFSGKHTA
jgi:hypothetical protein